MTPPSCTSRLPTTEQGTRRGGLASSCRGRKRVRGELVDSDRALTGPSTYSRFLRARKFDITKAKIMWIDTQKWRTSFKVDELYETFDYTEKDQVNTLYPRCVL